MRKLLVTAALLLVSSASHAQYTIDYGGRTIRIDPDRGTVSIPGVFDNTGQGRSKKVKADPKADPKATAKPDQQQPPAQAKIDAPAATEVPAQAAVQPATPTAPAPVAPPSSAAAPAQSATAAPPATAPQPPAPAAAQASSPTPAPPAAPGASAITPPAAPVATQTRVANSPPAASAAVEQTSPLGVWLTEEKEGKVRIEQCGHNLCGYSVDTKSNQNGEQILINMRPEKDQKWSGRIVDPSTGSTYDSTIAMKGTDRLRVQGCAFGGMFCGGQTWTRVN